MPRFDFRDARCLVTGASMGLGLAMSSELARRGARVAMAARSGDRLRQAVETLVTSGIPAKSFLALEADITLPGDREPLFSAIDREFGGAIDLVINNAGIGAYGRFESHDESIARRAFEINVFALMEICRLALPRLRNGRGKALVNIGSIVARRGLPGRSEYSASKFAVAGFTEAIRAEWSRDGIQVTLINPGFTATDFEKNLLVDTAVHKTTHRRVMSAETVAKRTLSVISRRKNEATFSGPGRLLLFTNRLFPRFVDWGLGRWTRRLYERADMVIDRSHVD